MTQGEKDFVEFVRSLGNSGVSDAVVMLIEDRDKERRASDLWFARSDELRKRCDFHYRERKRIAKLESALRSAARWIKCHDIYGHMAKEILDEAKALLNDDGEFLTKNGGGSR